MTGTGDEEHVQIAFFDDAVEMNIQEVESGRGAPMAEQTRFNVLDFEGFLEQRIVEQIDLPNGKIIGRPPIGVHLVEQFR